MPKIPGFMAMKITEDNRSKIGIVNGGIVPNEDAIGAYFVFPYDFDAHCQILESDIFHNNFLFQNSETDRYFVDCIEA